MSTQEKEQKEPFVSRWSRRKQEAREQPQQEAPKPADARPLPELPPVDTLSFESDFRGFMDSRVDQVVRRIALKKLFTDPRFNITDGLDDYAEDYAALEDLPAAMVDKLQHARRTLRGPEPEESETPETQVAGEHIEQTAETAETAETTETAEEAQALADTWSPEDDGAVQKGADETEQRSS
ncbi:MAG: DUF3306 domain-containing protein [Burkholderiales bacterium]|nr:DUF3306 domain-containing protein [Burkholderiales bacterium]